MKTRIYVVTVLVPIVTDATEKLHEKRYLVDATSRQAAERHVANKYVSAEIAGGKDIAKLMANGATVEQAAKDDAEAQSGTLPGMNTTPAS